MKKIYLVNIRQNFNALVPKTYFGCLHGFRCKVTKGMYYVGEYKLVYANSEDEAKQIYKKRYSFSEKTELIAEPEWYGYRAKPDFNNLNLKTFLEVSSLNYTKYNFDALRKEMFSDDFIEYCKDRFGVNSFIDLLKDKNTE